MIRIGLISLLVILFMTGCATETVTSNTWTNDALQQNPLPPKSPLAEKDSKVFDDLWERIRLGFDIPDPDAEIINKHVRLLQSNPKYVNRLLERSSAYLFYIIEEVESRDMPSELALLPFVESAFNPKAVSPVKAAGMWQFMPATGKFFNLEQNIFRDERGDIIKSTRAALDYLQKLYDMFGDWQLALAAYNWGEGSVSRAIAKNTAANLETDYFSLSMPNETKNYVPKLLAYKRIIDEPERYGFTLPKVDNHPYFVSLPVTQDIDVDKVIELSEITREQFLALNPSFNGPVILQGFNQEILLPYGKSEIFKKNLKKHQSSLSSWTVVKVDKTDTVDNVAERLHTDPDVIREMNKIPKGMKIRNGSTLLIPKVHNSQENVPLELAQNPSLSLEKEFVPVPVVMRCKGKKCIAVPTNLANYSSKEYTNSRNVSRTSQTTNNSKKISTSKTSKNNAAKSTTAKQSNTTAKQSNTTATKSLSASSNTKPATVSQKATPKANTSKKQSSNY
jgi:membrane-bound lytic murein transglycosylase D